jgi:hypothetical protein
MTPLKVKINLESIRSFLIHIMSFVQFVQLARSTTRLAIAFWVNSHIQVSNLSTIVSTQRRQGQDYNLFTIFSIFFVATVHATLKLVLPNLESCRCHLQNNPVHNIMEWQFDAEKDITEMNIFGTKADKLTRRFPGWARGPVNCQFPYCVTIVHVAQDQFIRRTSAASKTILIWVESI